MLNVLRYQNLFCVFSTVENNINITIRKYENFLKALMFYVTRAVNPSRALRILHENEITLPMPKDNHS